MLYLTPLCKLEPTCKRTKLLTASHILMPFQINVYLKIKAFNTELGKNKEISPSISGKLNYLMTFVGQKFKRFAGQKFRLENVSRGKFSSSNQRRLT